MAIKISDKLANALIQLFNDLFSILNDPRTFIEPIPDYVVEMTMKIEELLEQIQKEFKGNG